MNRAATACNAFTLPYPRYCEFHNKIKIHLALQRQQLWGSTLQSRRLLKRKKFPDPGHFIFLDCPQVISNCCGWKATSLKEETEEERVTQKGCSKSLIRKSKTLNYNSNRLNGHKMQFPEMNSPLSAYCTVRQPLRALGNVVTVVRK